MSAWAVRDYSPMTLIYPSLFRVYLKDTDGQSQGIPCVLQKFNKDGSLSDELPGLMVRYHSSRLIQSYLLTHLIPSVV